jgi:DNA-binding NarL/FixJ family response regulator
MYKPNPPCERLRVFVAEANRMSGQLIAGALSRCRANFDVRSFSGDSPSTFRELQNYKPHVSLISAELKDGAFTGFTVLHQLCSFERKSAAVMLLNSDEREIVIDAFRAGARGVFCRGSSFKKLPKCIRRVHEGQIWASNNHLEFLLDVVTRSKRLNIQNTGGMHLLTPRETDVTRLVVQGMRNQEISTRLNLREHTVRNYLLRIFEKLGISSRVELVLYAVSLPQTDQPNEGPVKIARATDPLSPDAPSSFSLRLT